MTSVLRPTNYVDRALTISYGGPACICDTCLHVISHWCTRSWCRESDRENTYACEWCIYVLCIHINTSVRCTEPIINSTIVRIVKLLEPDWNCVVAYYWPIAIDGNLFRLRAGLTRLARVTYCRYYYRCYCSVLCTFFSWGVVYDIDLLMRAFLSHLVVEAFEYIDHLGHVASSTTEEWHVENSCVSLSNSHLH